MLPAFERSVALFSAGTAVCCRVHFYQHISYAMRSVYCQLDWCDIFFARLCLQRVANGSLLGGQPPFNLLVLPVSLRVPNCRYNTLNLFFARSLQVA